MSKRIVVIGTLDTRGHEVKYLAEVIERSGHTPIVVDIGVLGEPYFEPTISKFEVARASGSTLEEIISRYQSEGEAMAKMAAGAAKLLNDLYSQDKLDGALFIGGTMGTAVALEVMKAFPIGLPKLLLSSVAFSSMIPADAITGDVMMMQWVAGLRGINTINRQVLHSAAGAIVGAAQEFERKRLAKEKKTVGLSSLGVVPAKYAASWIEPGLKKRGYEVAVFHASGMGGRMFEQAIFQGLIDAALDLELAEITNEVTGGIASAGKHRLEAAGKMGIPQIVAPTCDGIWWSPRRPVPRRFQDRHFRLHNWLVANAPSTKKEKVAAAKLIAEKLNKATGPTAVVLPLRGRGVHVGFDFPEEWKAMGDTLRDTLKPEVKLIELDTTINDRQFSETVLKLFDDMMQNR